jgi:ribulose bisphosphate carboxylase small subunit
MKTLPKERRYETLSYLPPLTDAQIERQIAYILKMGYFPAVEFNETPILRPITGPCGSCRCSTHRALKKS